MSIEPIVLPPGIRHNGTTLENKGRWYNGNLIRFFQGSVMPQLGSRLKSASAMTGVGRAIISWHDNAQTTWSAIGTESHLYAMTRAGTIADITPSGFTTSGFASAEAEGGFGDEVYGEGYPYGVPIPDSDEVQDADVWSLDNFGQYLVGVMPTDGNIYQWQLDTGTPATPLGGAPSAVALFTTAEGMLVALGANNNPRLVQWSDQQNDDTGTDPDAWTATASNQAGDYQLGGTNGRLMQGMRIKGSHLIFTDVDAWTMTYQANEFVYSLVKVGAEGCGAISRRCAMAVDAVGNAWGAMAVWMGQNGFYLFNGYVTPISCDVWDYVFNNLNVLQKSKITVEMNSDFGEITWRYPSGSSTEIDSYVTWNFRENHWTVGQSTRLSGVDGGVNSPFPMRVGVDGNVYEHEVGYAYETGMMPFIESAPLPLPEGDSAFDINELIPDSQIIPNCTATFFTKFYPGDASEIAVGPFTLSSNVGTRGVSGRQIRIRFNFTVATGWRLGINQIDIEQGDAR